MKLWKIGLGVGAACAACCAIPLFGLAGAVGAMAAFSTALWACAAEMGLVAAGVGAIGLAAFLASRRRRQRSCASQSAGCDCTGSCNTARMGA
jgi:hypothetical protein